MTDPLTGNYSDTPYNVCLYQLAEIPQVYIDLGTINWFCGSQVEIKNFQMAWQNQITEDCKWDPPKCACLSDEIVRAPLIANFSYDQSLCDCGPFQVTFNGVATGGQAPYTYSWNFGDGSSIVSEDPIHDYSTTGPYTVTLTVTDAIGTICTKTESLTLSRDDTDPTLITATGALDQTLECSNSDGIAAALALVPTALDNCTSVPVLHLVSDVNTPGSCASEYVRVRTWNFTDACGNTSANFVTDYYSNR